MDAALLLLSTIVLCLLGNGFFSGGEIAVISVRRSQIDARLAARSRAALWVRALQDDTDRYLATVQIGVTLMGTLAGVLGGYLASRHLEPLALLGLPPWVSAAVVAGTLVGSGIVFVELILGELVPKALARFTENVALLVAGPLHLMERVSRPLVDLLTACTRGVLFLIGVREAGHRTFVSEEEIKHELGSLPRGGESVVAGGCRFTVVDVERNRIAKVKIEKLPAPDPQAPEPDA